MTKNEMFNFILREITPKGITFELLAYIYEGWKLSKELA